MTKSDWIDLALQLTGMCMVFALLASFTPNGVPRMADNPGSYVLALGSGLLLGFVLRRAFRRIQRKRPG